MPEPDPDPEPDPELEPEPEPELELEAEPVDAGGLEAGVLVGVETPVEVSGALAGTTGAAAFWPDEDWPSHLPPLQIADQSRF